ncbi:MAG: PAQR family membrane homeostasis protein TrhA [Planctomycetota bacterium]
MVPSEFTRGEEAANVACHGVGALGSVVALITLLQMAANQGSAMHVVTCAVFGCALILVYTTSTLYHLSNESRRREFLQYVDHCSIYILIAATYTPFCLVLVQGGWGWTIFGLTWAIAAIGILIKSMPSLREKGRLSVASYLAAGWLALIGIKPIYERLDVGAFLLILFGGVAYTLGVVFFLWEKLAYHHAIWHLMVLVGSTLHFLGVLLYVIPAAT